MSKSTAIPASTGGAEGGQSNESYPPRPSKTNRALAKKSTKGKAKAGKHQQSASAAGEAECVPHVVRVTFLGVAGLQAIPVREPASQTAAAQASIATDAATANTGTENDTHGTGSTTASPSHPSLLIPMPSNLRVVATVSRAKTARGIASGMSRVLKSSQKSSIPSIPSIVDTNSDLGRSSAGDDKSDRKDLLSPSQVAESRSRSKDCTLGSEMSAADEVINVGVEVVSPMLESHKEPVQDADDEPERFVALWSDNGSTAKSPNNALNYSNSLAFEADLRPSTSTSSSAAKDAPGSAAANTEYAPKSFCVTVGLLPDSKPKTENESPAATNADDGDPAFAIPIGFANLVVKGNETLDGKRAQVDLPLSTLSSVLGQDTSRGNSKATSSGTPFPIIELTRGAADGKVDSKRGKKDRKQSLVKRMFSRRQPLSDSTASVYDGKPRSIYQLGRHPNAGERSLFLDRYSVDPSGDAVLRVGLEVFARGSELEKVFRRKNRLRKEKRRSMFNAVAASPQSIGGRSRSGDSCDSSLFDSFDSDDDSIYSQSFLTSDTFTDGQTTWHDGSTMFTDGWTGLSPSYTDGTSKGTKDEDVPNSSARRFLTKLLNCGATTGNCIVNDCAEGEVESEFDPIEQVAIAKSPKDNSLLVNESSQDPASGYDAGQSTTKDATKNATIEGGIAVCATPTVEKVNSSKKTNSSVTCDSADTTLAGTVGADIKDQPHESIIDRVVVHDPSTMLESDATKPVVDSKTHLEALTSVTLENEISPLATIQHVHRTGTEDPLVEGGTAEQSCDREVEYTLEQHKSG